MSPPSVLTFVAIETNVAGVSDYSAVVLAFAFSSLPAYFIAKYYGISEDAAYLPGLFVGVVCAAACWIIEDEVKTRRQKKAQELERLSLENWQRYENSRKMKL
jgi:hypothetical protein